MRLWIDEIRAPQTEGWERASSIEEAKEIVVRARERHNFFRRNYLFETSNNALISEINLNAVGARTRRTYLDFLKWLKEEEDNGRIDCSKILFTIHFWEPTYKETLQRFVVQNGWRLSA